MNLVERTKLLLLAGGAEWVLWLLVVLSIVSLSIIAERTLLLLQTRGDIDLLRRHLAGDLRHGRVDATRQALERSRHPAARVVLRGLERAASSATAEQVQQAMEAETLAQRARLERRLSFLGTLGSNAPFVGLFGTVIGIVAAFDHLGSAPPGAGAGSTLVMAAIGEALVSTAVGIGVAIPAIFGFNQLLRIVKQRMSGADLLSRELLSALPLTGGPARDDRDAAGAPGGG
jgi:biopolymer transport protein ExbB